MPRRNAFARGACIRRGRTNEARVTWAQLGAAERAVARNVSGRGDATCAAPASVHPNAHAANASDHPKSRPTIASRTAHHPPPFPSQQLQQPKPQPHKPIAKRPPFPSLLRPPLSAADAVHTEQAHAPSIVIFITCTGVFGRSPESVGVASIFATTSCPETIFPNTGCFD